MANTFDGDQGLTSDCPILDAMEGLERYSVNVCYPRGYRDNVPALRNVLASTPGRADVPLGQLADF